ncbi:BMP family ABC transporter substrate-binding protein [Undibacterium arcticum]
MQFRETEASYLAGIAAGLTSHNGKVGMIAAFDTPVRRQNAEAFAAGAIAAKPTISVYDPQWIGGEQPFNDPARGEQVAKAMLAAGVDTIFSTAAVSNQGVFRAVAAQPKARVIGHPVNQCRVLPGKVLDNVEVHLDIAILLAVGEALRGTVRERMDFGLREGALSMTSLSPDAALSECEITKERALLLKLREAKKRSSSAANKVAGGASTTATHRSRLHQRPASAVDLRHSRMRCRRGHAWRQWGSICEKNDLFPNDLERIQKNTAASISLPTAARRAAVASCRFRVMIQPANEWRFHPGPAPAHPMSATFESSTLSVRIERDWHEVFDFVSVPENFPKWASGLGAAIRRSGDAWIAATEHGPVRVRFSARNDFWRARSLCAA